MVSFGGAEDIEGRERMAISRHRHFDGNGFILG